MIIFVSYYEGRFWVPKLGIWLMFLVLICKVRADALESLSERIVCPLKPVDIRVPHSCMEQKPTNTDNKPNAIREVSGFGRLYDTQACFLGLDLCMENTVADPYAALTKVATFLGCDNDESVFNNFAKKETATQSSTDMHHDAHSVDLKANLTTLLRRDALIGPILSTIESEVGC